MKRKTRSGSPSSSSPPSPHSLSLPTDLIIEILLKLPVKSLCKFRCVSKKFHGLMTDPHFISTHRELRVSNPCILLVKKTDMPLERILCTKMDFFDFGGVYKNVEFSLYLECESKMLHELIHFMCNSGFIVWSTRQVMLELPKPSCYPLFVSEGSAGMGYFKESDEYALAVKQATGKLQLELAQFSELQAWCICFIEDGMRRSIQTLGERC